MNLTKILIAIVVVAAIVVLARILLKPSELTWVNLPVPDCDEMVITTSVKGGTGIYEYSIDNGKYFIPAESGKLTIPIEREGDYFIHVRDGENVITHTLTVPCRFKAQLEERNPCLDDKVDVTTRSYRETGVGAADGKIKLSIKGGCTPYSVYLDGKLQKSSLAKNSYTITGLAPGGYKLRIESKEKENFLDIPNKVYVAEYKAPAPKISKEKLEKRINEFIEGGFEYNARVKIQRYFADENTSVNSEMIGITAEQAAKPIDEYLSRLDFQSDIIKWVKVLEITFDDNNDIKTYTVQEIPK